jgi:hypothetical protein
MNKGAVMSILSKLSSALGRKDEEPNKALGKELATNNDTHGIQEIVENLHNEDKRIQTDCLSVLEQVGLLAPHLIEEYVKDLLPLIFSKDNRLVWAAMIDLALIADRKPEEIFNHFEEIIKVIDKGSVITKDNGIKTLAKVASTNIQYKERIMPYLLDQLRDCRPKSVPQYAESIQVAVTPEDQDAYLSILNGRFDGLSPAQQRRVKKLLKSF